MPDVEQKDECWTLDETPPQGTLRFALLATRFNASDSQGLSIRALAVASADFPLKATELRLLIGDKPFAMELTPCSPASGSPGRPGLFRFASMVPTSALADMGEENRIAIVGARDGREICRRAITYRAFRKGYKALHGPILHFKLPGDGRAYCAYFRQTRKNTLILSVRPENQTDALASRLKIACAWLVAKIPGAQRPIVVYEKNASTYGESGKEVFEDLCAHGYRNVRYVVARNALPDEGQTPPACRGKFLEAHSFSHYYAFFRSHTLIGTELPLHALERNTVSRLAQRHIAKPEVNFVFLQHGVMYMVSLNSFQRGFFHRKSLGCSALVCVSSDKEKRHFTELAGYAENEILLTGLPKLDAARREPDADLILIMPTWRPWEATAARQGGEQTGYWRMVKGIVDAVPADLRDKVVVHAHPLFRQSLDTGIGFKTHTTTENLDGLLQRTRVLITDYSSVAYDAFYRGANVVFYWGDLEECMQRYGGPAHLMINRDTAPGFVCASFDELPATIEFAYREPQPLAQQENYRTIVEFHDGHNAQRLREQLETRGLLHPTDV